MGAIIVGLARSIAVVRKSKIMDSIVHGLGSVIDGATPTAVVGMYIVQVLINFIISFRKRTSVSDNANHGTISRYVRYNKTDRSLSLPIRRRIYTCLLSNKRVLYGSISNRRRIIYKMDSILLPTFIVWGVISIISLIFAQLIGWS